MQTVSTAKNASNVTSVMVMAGAMAHHQLAMANAFASIDFLGQIVNHVFQATLVPIVA